MSCATTMDGRASPEPSEAAPRPRLCDVSRPTTRLAITALHSPQTHPTGAAVTTHDTYESSRPRDRSRPLTKPTNATEHDTARRSTQNASALDTHKPSAFVYALSDAAARRPSALSALWRQPSRELHLTSGAQPNSRSRYRTAGTREPGMVAYELHPPSGAPAELSHPAPSDWHPRSPDGRRASARTVALKPQ